MENLPGQGRHLMLSENQETSGNSDVTITVIEDSDTQRSAGGAGPQESAEDLEDEEARNNH